MIELIYFLAFFAVGYMIGRDISDIHIYIKSLKKPTTKPTVTSGTFDKPNGDVNKKSGAGVIQPKTPQRIEWEAENKLREMQYK